MKRYKKDHLDRNMTELKRKRKRKIEKERNNDEPKKG